MTDFFGRELPSVEATFTTGRKIMVSGYKLNGTQNATKLTNGVNKFEFTCASGDSSDKSVILIAAVYNSDKTKLLDVNFTPDVLPADGTYKTLIIENIFSDVSYSDAGAVSVMLWDGINKIYPYTEAIDLSK